MNKKTLVVNLFAGPGTGKSKMMAHIFAELKWKGIDCEMASEYAKVKVWEGSHAVLNDQFYVSGKQFHRMYPLMGQIDVLVTDSPLLLGMYYGRKEPVEFHNMLLKKHSQFNNFNILLERRKAFNPNGRLQDETQAKEIDVFIAETLDKLDEEYIKIPAIKENVDKIVNMIIEALEQLKQTE